MCVSPEEVRLLSPWGVRPRSGEVPHLAAEPPPHQRRLPVPPLHPALQALSVRAHTHRHTQTHTRQHKPMLFILSPSASFGCCSCSRETHGSIKVLCCDTLSALLSYWLENKNTFTHNFKYISIEKAPSHGSHSNQ